MALEIGSGGPDGGEMRQGPFGAFSLDRPALGRLGRRYVSQVVGVSVIRRFDDASSNRYPRIFCRKVGGFFAGCFFWKPQQGSQVTKDDRGASPDVFYFWFFLMAHWLTTNGQQILFGLNRGKCSNGVCVSR
ncbi:MAG: hypothetical protein CM15mP68_0390 [Pseudomonadota bacterium]|nr:MAG: hypothetical protein CM15mP68_0390 [Pseudomonadota bacterium]